MLGVRQRWAGRVVANPMGWATVQTWARQVQAALGGVVLPSALVNLESALGFPG